MTDAATEKIILILSGRYGHRIVPVIHDFQQLKAVYIHCNNVSANEEWSEQFNKVKGIYSEMTPIVFVVLTNLRTLQRMGEYPIAMNIYTTQQGEGRNASEERDSKNAAFMFFQLLIDIVLQMATDQNSKAKQDLINHFERIYEEDDAQCRIIEEFANDYRPEKAIWWYTRPTFLYFTLNKALRESDLETLLTLRFFIKDLHAQLSQQCQQYRQSCTSTDPILRVYRGQAITIKDLDFIRNNVGQFVSMQSFLSTSFDRATAFFFAQANAEPSEDNKQIVFQFNIDTRFQNSKPYADIQQLSYFKNEEEVLIMLGAIFRIEHVKYDHHDKTWIGTLTLCGEDDYELRDLLKLMKNHIGTDIPSLGFLLLRRGDWVKAQKFFQGLLSETTLDDVDRVNCYKGLGVVASELKLYDEALKHHHEEASLLIQLGNETEAAVTFTNIGMMYCRKKEFDQALFYEQKALDILLPLNHPQLSNVYHSIANIYTYKNKFKLAIEHFEKSLQINRQHFPPNDSSFGIIYRNMANAYLQNGHYQAALNCCHKAREIWLKSLPSNHPHILTVNENIRGLEGRLNRQ